MREINLSAGAMPGKVIPLYYQGEKNATCIRIDLSDYVALFGGDGEAQLLYQRPGDEAPYAVTLTREGDVVSWKVIKRDVARPGRGWLQLVYTAGETEALSPKLATYAAPSLGQETDPPEEERPWYDEALQAAKDAEEAAARAEDAADRAEAAAEGGGGGSSDLLWRPTVSEDGEISWEQSASDTPPEPVNIMGPQGPAGADGAGGGWENLPLVRTETIEEEVKGIELSELDIQHRAMIVVEMPKTTTTTLYAGVSVYINGKTPGKRFLNFNTYGIFLSIAGRQLFIYLDKVANGSYKAYGYCAQKGAVYNTSHGMVSAGGSKIPPYYAGESVPQSIYLESQKDDVIFPAGTKIDIYREANA